VHFHAEVWFHEKPAHLDKAVSEAMAPYKEGEEEENPRGFFDWWQIGGRWTGKHDPSYNPQTDPENIETCDLCAGTGFRRDDVGINSLKSTPTYTCNGCGTYDQEKKSWVHGPLGPGRRTKWPSQWRRFEGDVAPLETVPDDLECYTIIGPGFAEHEETGKLKSVPVKKFLSDRGITDGWLVTVDYHV